MTPKLVLYVILVTPKLVRHSIYFLFTPLGGASLENNSLHFTKPLRPTCSYSYRNFLPCFVFRCYCLSLIFILSHLFYFCPVYLCVVCFVNIVMNLLLHFRILRPIFTILYSWFQHLLLLGLHSPQILDLTIFLHLYLFLSFLAGHF